MEGIRCRVIVKVLVTAMAVFLTARENSWEGLPWSVTVMGYNLVLWMAMLLRYRFRVFGT
jgi:hypothetical protein